MFCNYTYRTLKVKFIVEILYIWVYRINDRSFYWIQNQMIDRIIMQVAGISDRLVEDKLDEFLPIFDEAKIYDEGNGDH